jgi:hypothetical protein
MAARLPALGDYDIDATLHGTFGVSRCADGVENGCTARLCARDQGRWITPEERDDWDALVETHREALFLGKLQIQVHAKRP